MDKQETNYNFWDEQQLINGFDKKKRFNFFRTETYFLDCLNFTEIKSVLDVGCSCGRFYELLEQRYDFSGEYSGLDISKPSIERCRNNYPEMNFIHDNALNLKTDKNAAAGHFDLVNATGVMQHEPEYKALINKMIELSERYILFDVKIANVENDLIDIDQSYCEISGNRIHIIPLSLPYLIKFLASNPAIGSVKIFGYSTPFNQSTVVPTSILSWASAGIFIDKLTDFEIQIINFPDKFKQ